MVYLLSYIQKLMGVGSVVIVTIEPTPSWTPIGPATTCIQGGNRRHALHMNACPVGSTWGQKEPGAFVVFITVPTSHFKEGRGQHRRRCPHIQHALSHNPAMPSSPSSHAHIHVLSPCPHPSKRGGEFIVSKCCRCRCHHGADPPHSRTPKNTHWAGHHLHTRRQP